ncbi:unnamed protein product, partial [Rotaria sordida]
MASNKVDVDADDISVISVATNCTTKSTVSNFTTSSDILICDNIVDEISQVLELDFDEQRNEIISDILRNGRQVLVKYQSVLIPEVYSAEINNFNDDSITATAHLSEVTPLLKLIKQYVYQRWETACANEPTVWEFINKLKAENNDHFEAVLRRTAEYGTTYTKSSSILAVVLQLLFQGIDDDCLRNESVFVNLWNSVTSGGLHECNNFATYIPEDDLKEQLHDPDSPLFLALRMYYHEKIPHLFKEYKIPNSKQNLHKLAADNVTQNGWLAGIQSVKGKIPPVKYEPLLQAIKTMVTSSVSEPPKLLSVSTVAATSTLVDKLSSDTSSL